MDDVEDIANSFPNTILPEFRKKRTYLNAILSKNEVSRNDPYNRKLFLRIARGVYVINPDLDILVAEDHWMNAYDMMFTEKMTRERNEAIVQEEIRLRHQRQMEAWHKQQQRLEAERKRQQREWEERWRW